MGSGIHVDTQKTERTYVKMVMWYNSVIVGEMN